MNIAFMRKCKTCGKEVYISPDWVYKKDNHYYCSWKCYRQANTERKKEFVMPKVGDKIRIRNLASIIDYYGRVGVVTGIDDMGQLHGTWGELVVVPSEDKFEIIGESE